MEIIVSFMMSLFLYQLLSPYVKGRCKTKANRTVSTQPVTFLREDNFALRITQQDWYFSVVMERKILRQILLLVMKLGQ